MIVVLTDARTPRVSDHRGKRSGGRSWRRVFTIGFGTTTPSRMACTGQQAGDGPAEVWVAVPVGRGAQPRVIDEDALKAIAEITGGQYYRRRAPASCRRRWVTCPVR